ncbi:MAG: excinuclease ABC subunit UvrA [Candidatus Kaiserbacteria bacterium]|nr:excinuclease ABC subunit UvrA [Candidatus Kaiserbacteria bacterium]
MATAKKKKTEDDWIRIRGAATHNLKDIDVDIPRNMLTVCTGLSGSGKSSLAFDTIFAEGQRRYIESLSTYARQFLRQMQKPEVREISGLSPAISIDQKNRSNNPRSTVATITELYDYLRVLFSRVGTPHCPTCSRVIEKVSKDDIIRTVEKKIKEEKWLSKTKTVAKVPLNDRIIQVFAPVVIGRKGEHYQLLYDLLRKGYETARIDGTLQSLRTRIVMDKNKKHDVDILVDSLYLSDYAKDPGVFRERLSDAVDRSIHEADGLVRFFYPDESDSLVSSRFLCPVCGFSFPEIEPRLFSFNSPYGACPDCNGLGHAEYFSDDVCKTCQGSRLRPEALHVFLKDTSGNLSTISSITTLTIAESTSFFKQIDLSDQQREIAAPLLNEIESRISFLDDVGLSYITLDRRANTLSGGESQRIRLASQLGSGLVGALYVLDEPTIGLHQRDNDRLIQTLIRLRDLGNTIIVVEHDEDTIFASDYLVDIGPKAGLHGGEVVVSGFLDHLLAKKRNTSGSLTLAYLRGDRTIAVPEKRRTNDDGALSLKGASANNIQNVSIDVPLGKITAITGVSGSGKSTLLHDLIYLNLRHKLEPRLAVAKPMHAASFSGYEKLHRAILVDQSPIGRTPRSTPVTYVGAFTHIRDLFASTAEARYRGWKPGRFSFNVTGGRCEKCQGNGSIAVEMHFLPTMYVVCDSCFGKRYSKEVLSILYREKNIHDVLSMSVEEAEVFFKDIPAIHDRLKTLVDVGLGYLELGQPSTTLSGGEAQRVKIASELYRPDLHRTIYLLDEPTVGLHYEDVARLIEILNRLVDRGNTVLLIEHNLDVIKSCDYVIDMGPEGGADGGTIVAKGTPEAVAATAKSHTGTYLKKMLGKERKK